MPKSKPFGTTIAEIARQQLPTPSSPSPVTMNSVAQAQTQRTLAGELEKLKLEEFRQTLKLRARWSGFLMGAVVVMIVFQMMLFVSVGLGWLSFGDEWIARLVLPGTFAQILGFVYIIITYLFPTPDKKTTSPETKQ